MDPAELAELKAGMRANTEMIAVIGADRDKLAIEHAKLKATVEAKDKENKDLVTQLASLANAESIAQASQALAMMPAYINDETLEQKLLLPKDMFVTSHSVHAALCKNNPDLAFVKEKVGELIRLSGNYIAGIIAAMEQRKNKYTFCEVYYEITRAAALMKQPADWVPDSSIKREKDAIKSAVKRTGSDGVSGGTGGLEPKRQRVDSGGPSRGQQQGGGFFRQQNQGFHTPPPQFRPQQGGGGRGGNGGRGGPMGGRGFGQQQQWS
jgi:hypothetical protein